MSKVLVAATLAGGLMLVGSTAALAKGPPTQGGVSGTAKCAVNAVLNFSPPLQSGATGNTTVSGALVLTKCTASALHHRTTGHAAGTIGTMANGSCTLPSSTPSFSGLNIRWTPGPQVKPSSVSSAAGGAITTLSSGKGQLSFTDLAVTGSFATSSTPGTATLVTNASVASLSAQCNDTGPGGGVSAITFRGTATL